VFEQVGVSKEVRLLEVGTSGVRLGGDHVEVQERMVAIGRVIVIVEVEFVVVVEVVIVIEVEVVVEDALVFVAVPAFVAVTMAAECQVVEGVV